VGTSSRVHSSLAPFAAEAVERKPKRGRPQSGKTEINGPSAAPQRTKGSAGSAASLLTRASTRALCSCIHVASGQALPSMTS
jgi:hypothetical protein